MTWHECWSNLEVLRTSNSCSGYPDGSGMEISIYYLYGSKNKFRSISV